MARIQRGLTLPTEEQEQAWLAQYLDAMGLVWWHTPNGGHRDVRVAQKLVGQGVKAGVPDVVIVSRPPLRPDARGVAIELKRRNGGVVSAAQRQMIQRLEGEGWMCLISKGWEMAAEWLARECGWGDVAVLSPQPLEPASSADEDGDVDSAGREDRVWIFSSQFDGDPEWIDVEVCETGAGWSVEVAHTRDGSPAVPRRIEIPKGAAVVGAVAPGGGTLLLSDVDETCTRCGGGCVDVYVRGDERLCIVCVHHEAETKIASLQVERDDLLEALVRIAQRHALPPEVAPGDIAECAIECANMHEDRAHEIVRTCGGEPGADGWRAVLAGVVKERDHLQGVCAEQAAKLRRHLDELAELRAQHEDIVAVLTAVELHLMERLVDDRSAGIEDWELGVAAVLDCVWSALGARVAADVVCNACGAEFDPENADPGGRCPDCDDGVLERAGGTQPRVAPPAALAAEADRLHALLEERGVDIPGSLEASYVPGEPAVLALLGVDDRVLFGVGDEDIPFTVSSEAAATGPACPGFVVDDATGDTSGCAYGNARREGHELPEDLDDCPMCHGTGWEPLEGR